MQSPWEAFVFIGDRASSLLKVQQRSFVDTPGVDAKSQTLVACVDLFEYNSDLSEKKRKGVKSLVNICESSTDDVNARLRGQLAQLSGHDTRPTVGRLGRFHYTQNTVLL